jgi:hypothetical protein
VFIYFTAARYHVAKLERALDAQREEHALAGGEVHV